MKPVSVLFSASIWQGGLVGLYNKTDVWIGLVVFGPSGSFCVAAGAVFITCPAEPWVSSRSSQCRGWQEMYTCTCSAPPVYSGTEICSCAVSAPSALGFDRGVNGLDCVLTVLMWLVWFVCFCALFCLSYHGECDYQSVHHHHSSLLNLFWFS